MTVRVCAIAGCGRVHYGRSWCAKHYQKWLKHGDPLATKPLGQPARPRDTLRSPYKQIKHESGESREHRVIAERALGKPLPPRACVHHVNHDGMENRGSNLVICEDTKYHSLLHQRERVLRHGGNPNTERWCSICRRCLPEESFWMRHTGRKAGTRIAYCAECNRQKRREWRPSA